MKAEEIKVCVLRIEGTNCEEECAGAFSSSAPAPEKVHLKQLIGQCPEEMRRDLNDYHILALPGGFSAGDYVRAGAIFAARMKSGLSKELVKFVESGRPVIGICNGFQILVELGMLPALDGRRCAGAQAALYTNSSGTVRVHPDAAEAREPGQVRLHPRPAEARGGHVPLRPCRGQAHVPAGERRIPSWTSWSRTTRWCSDTWTRTASTPAIPGAPTGRCATSPGSATCTATCWA